MLRGSRFSMASNAVMILVVEAMARRSSGFFSKSTRPSSMLIRMPADPVISGAGGSLTAAPTVGGGDCEGAVVIPLGSVVLVVATDTGGSQHAATNTTASKTIRTVARGERAEGRPFAFETIVISIYHECPPASDGPRASAGDHLLCSSLRAALLRALSEPRMLHSLSATPPGGEGDNRYSEEYLAPCYRQAVLGALSLHPGAHQRLGLPGRVLIY
ncbi:MAG: hypothetical protein BWY79_01673 [Actinobacteria bacterium ADurb.Bin444]|nr:MAG: hypothetical protein BWY79_01673 [Actinobacteria bacterium ADurb.Bin444]